MKRQAKRPQRPQRPRLTINAYPTPQDVLAALQAACLFEGITYSLLPDTPGDAATCTGFPNGGGRATCVIKCMPSETRPPFVLIIPPTHRSTDEKQRFEDTVELGKRVGMDTAVFRIPQDKVSPPLPPVICRMPFRPGKELLQARANTITAANLQAMALTTALLPYFTEGVIHEDLQPNNVLMAEGAACHIIDIGDLYPHTPNHAPTPDFKPTCTFIGFFNGQNKQTLTLLQRMALRYLTLICVIYFPRLCQEAPFQAFKDFRETVGQTPEFNCQNIAQCLSLIDNITRNNKYTGLLTIISRNSTDEELKDQLITFCKTNGSPSEQANQGATTSAKRRFFNDCSNTTQTGKEPGEEKGPVNKRVKLTHGQ